MFINTKSYVLGDKLKAKLLSQGGFGVIQPQGDVPANLLIESHGHMFENYSLVRNHLENERAHRNCVELWIKSPEVKNICTGFALAANGFWIRHSWLIGSNKKIVETTQLQQKYFGFEIRNDDQANGLIEFIKVVYQIPEVRDPLIAQALEKIKRVTPISTIPRHVSRAKRPSI